MKIVCMRGSQNGRWGLHVVSSDIEDLPDLTAVQATAVKLGESGGIEVVRLDATNNESWVVVGDDLEPIEGCTSVVSLDLQGGQGVSLLVCGPTAVFRSYGYKRRSSWLYQAVNGRVSPLPEGIAHAMGLLGPIKEEAIEPPPFNLAFARLFGGK